ADARRLSRAVAGRPRRAARRRLAAARLSPRRVRPRRRTPRAAFDGGDPVRRRRTHGAARARAGRAVPQLAGGARGDRGAADEAAAHARDVGARDGRLPAGRRPRPRRRRSGRRALAVAQRLGARRLDLSDVDRRESAAVDLRFRDAAGERTGEAPDRPRAAGSARMMRRLLATLAALVALGVVAVAVWLHRAHGWNPLAALAFA